MKAHGGNAEDALHLLVHCEAKEHVLCMHAVYPGGLGPLRLKDSRQGGAQVMGRYFDENYELLNVKLDQMARGVQQVIEKTIQALEADDAQAAREIIEADQLLDQSENEIDEIVMKLFALQQPMAVDLRFLVTALKANNDLERMGDQAVNIAEGVLLLRENPLPERIVDFSKMEQAVRQMVGDCLEAFFKRQPQLARKICGRDDEVDEMNRQMIHKLACHLHEHPEHAEQCVTLILISHNLERIADLATNIAEDTVYYIEGRIVRHQHDITQGESEQP